jgi:hypothetical protein
MLTSPKESKEAYFVAIKRKKELNEESGTQEKPRIEKPKIE